MLKTKTDEELMQAYQLGEDFAFEELYQRYSKKVYNFLKKRLENQSSIEDVFQSVFLKLHNSKNLYNPAYTFAPWIFTVCRNELIDFLRKQKNLDLEFNDEDAPILDRPSAPHFNDLDLSSLSPEQRQAIELRYFKDSSFEDIAKALKTSTVNVRKIISRSIKKLRGHYAK